MSDQRLRPRDEGEHDADRLDDERGLSDERIRRLEQEVALRSARITKLSEELRELRRQVRSTERKLEAARQETVRLRRRPLVAQVLAVESAGIRAVRSLRRTVSSVAARRPGSGPAREGRHRLRATRREASAMQARLAGALVPTTTTSGPLVTAIVLTHEGLDHLRRLLPALDRLAYRDLEVIVVDNASTDGTAEFLRSARMTRPLRQIRNADNEAFSAGNNQGAAAAAGELLLFLNDDVEPAGPHVLGHMVDRLLDDPGLVAVGARLVYPRRSGPREGPISRAPDLTLQHRGIKFVTRRGELMARNVGAGENPLAPAASARRELEAATAACLLVRRSAFEAVGGFSAGYEYGSEDVDLCLRLTGAGGRIVYEPQATFWHHESATQYREDQARRQERQAANRALLANRFGPLIARAVLLDRLTGEQRWSEAPLHVGITLPRDDPGAGWGLSATAQELGDSLTALGWRVSYLERHEDRWDEPDSTLDAVVSLLDAFDVRRMPDGVVSVAWVRDGTDGWLSRPWFDGYDLVLTSSQRSKELIDAGSVHVAGLMPPATNPERFSRSPGEGERPVDVLATDNRWAEERAHGHRAIQIRDALIAWTADPRIDLLIGAPDWEVAETWGDYHFARGFQRALQRRGHPTRVRLRNDWEGPGASRADVAIHLLGRGTPSMREGQLSVLWIISHPDLRADEDLAGYDAVFAASDALAARLRARSGRPAIPLHQATDPERFRPIDGGPHHDLLFVANSRGVRRRIVDELTPTSLELAVYGLNWTPDLLDPTYLRGEHIANDQLAAYYSAAAIVLNDHWPDMIENGLFSNRLYDAAASGAFVISDAVPGIEAEFDGGIVTFTDGTELRELVVRYLAAPADRARLAARARQAVLERHTFEHRAAAMLEVIMPLLEARSSGAGDRE